MADREVYKKCGAKYRQRYKELWLGEVTRENLYTAIKEPGGIKCSLDQWPA